MDINYDKFIIAAQVTLICDFLIAIVAIFESVRNYP